MEGVAIKLAKKSALYHTLPYLGCVGNFILVSKTTTSFSARMFFKIVKRYVFYKKLYTKFTLKIKLIFF